MSTFYLKTLKKMGDIKRTLTAFYEKSVMYMEIIFGVLIFD